MPVPPYCRVPSYSHMTDEPPEKPRADSSLRPLPGWGEALMPAVRVTASITRESPRSSNWSRLMASTLAGVCMGVRPRLEPVDAGVASVALCPLVMVMGASVAVSCWANTGAAIRLADSGTAPSRRQRCVAERMKDMDLFPGYAHRRAAGGRSASGLAYRLADYSEKPCRLG